MGEKNLPIENHLPIRIYIPARVYVFILYSLNPVKNLLFDLFLISKLHPGAYSEICPGWEWAQTFFSVYGGLSTRFSPKTPWKSKISLYQEGMSPKAPPPSMNTPLVAWYFKFKISLTQKR